MTDRSSQHWYPTAAYLYTLHLDGPALAWEYLRRNPSYRRDWLRRRRKPDAAQAWPAPAGRSRPGCARRTSCLVPRSRCRGAAIPRRRPTTRCAYLRVLAHSWAQATDPRRQAPGARIALARLLRSAGTRTRPGRWFGLSLRHTRLRHALCALPHARCEAGCAICRNRGHACGNSPLRPTPAALLELHTLQALDATLAGASLREVGEGLFGADAVAADWHKDSALRARVRRLVRRGDELMHGGYRRLAQLPMFPSHWGRFSTRANRPLARSLAFLRVPLSGRVVWPGLMEVHPMRPAPSRPAAAAVTATSQPQRYLTNDEAADYLRLSPRTLEKQRVIGGGPKFRSSAAASCTRCPTSMPGPTSAATRPRPIPNTPSATRATTVMAADRRRVGGLRHVQPARASLAAARTARSVPRAAGRHGATRFPGLDGLSVLLACQVGARRRSTSAAGTSPFAWKARRSTASQRYGMPTC